MVLHEFELSRHPRFLPRPATQAGGSSTIRISHRTKRLHDGDNVRWLEFDVRPAKTRRSSRTTRSVFFFLLSASRRRDACDFRFVSDARRPAWTSLSRSCWRRRARSWTGRTCAGRRRSWWRAPPPGRSPWTSWFPAGPPSTTKTDTRALVRSDRPSVSHPSVWAEFGALGVGV